ncbi:hypothetical protein HKD37_14G039873 [Glycine soja]
MPKCREEEDKHKIYIGSATTRAYVQSPSNQSVLEISFNLVKSFTSQRFTRDVPSLVLFEKPREGKNQKNFQVVSPLNSLGREKRDTKEFRRLVLLFFWQRKKRDTKRIQAGPMTWSRIKQSEDTLQQMVLVILDKAQLEKDEGPEALPRILIVAKYPN